VRKVDPNRIITEIWAIRVLKKVENPAALDYSGDAFRNARRVH
jgi:hypothetical protein